MTDRVVRHANYGVELLDALTGGPIIGPSRVRASLLAPPPPGSGADLEPFLVNGNRWVFENLESDVELVIEAQHYVSSSKKTGTDLPSIPASTFPGLLNRVTLKPRSGYPFPASVTRVIGMVRLAAILDPNESPVAGADVTITPEYPASGPVLTTRTAEDGQYVMWFLPDLAQTQPLPISFSAVASATVVVNGSPLAVSGSISGQSVTPETQSGADPLPLS
ncbi:MAG: carboxypeptidase regulatory-like domain-containing protein [Myxococcales bacterium]|nr:carboxypeptidase regulatory-like domain-containing protein [Myxococcales bacterium]MCB9580283.1 carboxypeptidase regulatory-like domain-containing protein [Polyangiaceae bacterium]